MGHVFCVFFQKFKTLIASGKNMNKVLSVNLSRVCITCQICEQCLLVISNDNCFFILMLKGVKRLILQGKLIIEVYNASDFS